MDLSGWWLSSSQGIPFERFRKVDSALFWNVLKPNIRKRMIPIVDWSWLSPQNFWKTLGKTNKHKVLKRVFLAEILLKRPSSWSSWWMTTSSAIQLQPKVAAEACSALDLQSMRSWWVISLGSLLPTRDEPAAFIVQLNLNGSTEV